MMPSGAINGAGLLVGRALAIVNFVSALEVGSVAAGGVLVTGALLVAASPAVTMDVAQV